MGKLILGEQSTPTTPSAGLVTLYPETTGLICSKDDAGRNYGYTSNASVANQGAGFATDTWVTNSDLLIPSFVFQAKAIIRWRGSCSKGANSTATPIYTIKTGSLRSTSDTTRLTLTGPAQTAIADIGTLCIDLVVRTGGAATILQGSAYWIHQGTAASTTVSGTGFANNSTGHVQNTGGSFDSTAMAGTYISLAINAGTSADWTFTQITAEAIW